MYRCDICKRLSEAGKPRIVHLLYRTNGTILREIPVCGSCKAALRDGVDFERLWNRHRIARVKDTQPEFHKPEAKAKTEAPVEVPPSPPLPPPVINQPVVLKGAKVQAGKILLPEPPPAPKKPRKPRTKKQRKEASNGQE